MTDEDIFLKTAIVFEEEYPAAFAKATEMIREHAAPSSIIAFLRSTAPMLDYMNAAHLMNALRKVTLGVYVSPSR
jgi:hypothetical protein